MDFEVSENLDAELMRMAGIVGLPGPAKVKRLKGVATADDLVHRKFHRLSPNELWGNDITEHPTREGKVYCCAVSDTFSRKIVGWSVDDCQDSTPVEMLLDLVEYGCAGSERRREVARPVRLRSWLPLVLAPRGRRIIVPSNAIEIRSGL